MPSNKTDGVPKYEGEKTCETCGRTETCEIKKISGEPGIGFPCWEAPAVPVRRPRDMCCILAKLGSGGMCYGRRCFLWSTLGPEEETGVPGTCLLALLASGAVGRVGGCVAPSGHAMEEGEGS